MPIEPLMPSAILPWEADDFEVEPADDTLPTLSLVVPIYNAGAYLERTLRSLALNNLDGVEVIVMDGASTDATPDILAHYAQLLDVVVSEPDERIEYEITQGSPLKGHRGIQVLTPTADGGTHLDYTIHFDAPVPGVAAAVAKVLTQKINANLPKLVPSASAPTSELVLPRRLGAGAADHERGAA